MYVYVCVCVCVCVWECVCVFTSIHYEGLICLDQLGDQGNRSTMSDLHRYFRMQNLTFLTSHFILLPQ